jgi:disulfide bond formation protein DsbB
VNDALVDVRGPRFAAWVTTVVLAVVLITSSAVLLGVQAVVFLLGAVFGLRVAPYGWFFRTVVAPRLGPPAELEAEAPPRFAQAVGFGFAVVGTVGFAAGWTVLGLVATAFALAAAFLNAAFGFCLGCELYLLFRRATTRSSGSHPSGAPAGGTPSVTRRGVEV